MKKVITLNRTSTDKQEVESQSYENIEYLKKLGYEEDEIIVIGSAGASAIKLDERYKENLNLFYETLENTPTIELVFAWAIDRIGRNEEVLMRFKNTLIDKKIQLQIKEPSLTLLNDDGTVNTGVELAFSLFATMAKQEMQMKNARFKRAKERNKREHKFNGGKIKFGYTVDEGGHIQENEEEANILRSIIFDYLNSNISQLSLFKEYKLRGHKFSYQTFRKFFEGDYYGCGENNYPPIFDQSTFEKVRAKTQTNKTNVDKGIRNYFLGAKLIKCPNCGRSFLANKGSGGYMCKQSTKQENYKCNCRKNININAVDSVAWYAGMEAQMHYINDCKENDIKKITNQIDNENKKLETLKEMTTTEFEERVEYYYERFSLGKISKKMLDKQLNKIEQTQTQNKQLMAQCKNTIKQLQTTLDNISNDNQWEMFKNLYNDYDSNEIADADKYAIVHQHIKEIKFEDVDKDYKIEFNFDRIGQTKRIKGVELTVYYYNEQLPPKTFVYNPNAKSKVNERVLLVRGNTLKFTNIVWLERINRHKAMKERKARKNK